MQRLVARMLRRKVLDTEPTHLLRTLGFWDLTACVHAPGYTTQHPQLPFHSLTHP